MATGLAIILFATVMATEATRAGESVLNWDPAEAAAKPLASHASSGGPEHAIFRNILQDPRFDRESFWDRDQRWVEYSNLRDTPAPMESFQGSGSALSANVLLSSISLSELSLALTPLLLGWGLLLLKGRADLVSRCS